MASEVLWIYARTRYTHNTNSLSFSLSLMSSLELRLLLGALALAARLLLRRVDARAMHVELDESLRREGRKVGALDNCAGRAGEV